MAWKESNIVDQRYRFILDVLSGTSMAEACRRGGIDRKTGYKWKGRFEANGRAGLVDLPRIAHYRPHSLEEEVADVLLALRRKRPTWGPKKLLKYLAPRHAMLTFPARSTVSELLKREGLSCPRKKRERVASYDSPLAGYHGPNAVWCADFKGPMKLGKGTTAPLTITDGTSRYCLRCDHLSKLRTKPVQKMFTRAFYEYGLPDVIRTDNGPPFATVGLAGLGALSVWWIKLGIRPERIEPGCPTQNGRHERLHRTMNEDLALLLVKTSRPQPLFDRFRQDFNQERPHEALNFQTPADVYRPSPKCFPTKLKDPEYKSGFVLERLGKKGELFWRGKTFYLNKVLADELVGIDIDSEPNPKIYFGPIYLGHIAQNRFWPRTKRTCKSKPTNKPNT